MTFSPATAAEITFLPLADPERRAADPIRALEAAHDLQITLGIASQSAASQARAQGRTWTEIGDALNITKQAAQQRFGLLADLYSDPAAEYAEDAPPPEVLGCPHALDAHNCPDPGGCPDARDAITRDALR